MGSGAIVSIEADVAAAQAALEGTGKGMAAIRRRALSAAAQGTRRATAAAIRSTTERRTGELLKAYRYKVKKGAREANVFPRKATKDSQIFPKAYALSYGTEKTAHRARGFVQAGRAYAEGGAYKADIERLVQKELDKVWGG